MHSEYFRLIPNHFSNETFSVLEFKEIVTYQESSKIPSFFVQRQKSEKQNYIQ